jgi:hypothetical protein
MTLACRPFVKRLMLASPGIARGWLFLRGIMGVGVIKNYEIRMKNGGNATEASAKGIARTFSREDERWTEFDLP